MFKSKIFINKKMLKIIQGAIIFLIVIEVGDTFEEKDMACTEDYCNKYKEVKGCPELSKACRVQNSTHNGIFLPWPDICNCCKYCIENLGLDEACTRGSPGMPPPEKICGPGLACTENEENVASCKPMKTDCTNSQSDWDERRKEGILGMIEVRPICDEDGNFSPIHCIPGSICYCKSPNGERIFGELPFLDSSDEQKMSCGCSINHWKAMKSVNPAFVDVALTARCTSIGLFDALLCTMGKKRNCFCVDPVSGEPTEGPVSLEEIEKLKCFDSSIHEPGKYESRCEIMKAEWHENSTSIDRPVYEIGEFENPKCQPDGLFDRVQIVDKKIICVDPFGKQIDNFSSPIITSENRTMDTFNDKIENASTGRHADKAEINTVDCNCARVLWLLRKSGIQELPICNNDGSFRPIQRFRNQYFCVNRNGDQIGLEQDSESALGNCTLQ